MIPPPMKSTPKRHEWDLSLEISAHKHIAENVTANHDLPWVYVNININLCICHKLNVVS